MLMLAFGRPVAVGHSPGDLGSPAANWASMSLFVLPVVTVTGVAAEHGRVAEDSLTRSYRLCCELHPVMPAARREIV